MATAIRAVSDACCEQPVDTHRTVNVEDRPVCVVVHGMDGRPIELYRVVNGCGCVLFRTAWPKAGPCVWDCDGASAIIVKPGSYELVAVDGGPFPEDLFVEIAKLSDIQADLAQRMGVRLC